MLTQPHNGRRQMALSGCFAKKTKTATATATNPTRTNAAQSTATSTPYNTLQQPLDFGEDETRRDETRCRGDCEWRAFLQDVAASTSG
mgnify:CR=1 FL=1